MIMNDVKVIKDVNLLGFDFAVYGTPENPLFVASDVASIIEHPNPSELIKLVDDDEKLTSKILRSGQMREMWLLTEDGLYEVLMRSTKPIAKQFKKGVKKILKEIRTTGSYISTAFAIPQTLSEALRLAADQAEKIEDQKRQLEMQEPAVTFTKAVQGSNRSCLVGELAKLICQNGYEIGQNRLFEWLRDNGYLGKGGERYNVPNQQYIEQGLFEIKRSGNDGVLHTTSTTKVTGKGQVYFINKFLDQII